MRNVTELIETLKARGDDLSLDAAAKIERQADLLETQYSHDRELYLRIYNKATRVVRKPEDPSALDALREEINNDV